MGAPNTDEVPDITI